MTSHPRRRAHGRRGRLAIAAGLIAAALLVAGCSGGAEEPAETPADVLARAKETLDATTGVAVKLSGESLPTAGTVLVGGTGTAAHPSSFEGELRITQDGLAVTAPIVSIDGTVWAQLPFTTSFAEIDPADFGVGDPGRLISVDDGVSSLLTADPTPEDAGQVRLGEDVLQEFVVELPGQLVGDLLTIADASATVAGRFAVDLESGQLRRATLTGPFYAGGEQTYTLLLDQYGLAADISAPTTG